MFYTYFYSAEHVCVLCKLNGSVASHWVRPVVRSERFTRAVIGSKRS